MADPGAPRATPLLPGAGPRPRPYVAPRGGARGVAPAPARLWASIVLVALSLGLVVSSAGLDGYLHRGVVWGDPPAAPATGGLILGMNVFLEQEPEQANIQKTVAMLKAAHVTFVRQTFSWAEIEPAPGIFADPKTGQSTWAKYDNIVDQLHAAGIGILARVDTIPRWARPPTDDFAKWDKGPPQDFNNYANFVATLAARYRGKISHYQVWNEPNLQGEWGGKPISPQQYGLLLKYTYPKVKAADPAALVVTAGLAQTADPGPANMNELSFIQGLYDAGAKDYFDILSVMDYGIGASPLDRRVSPDRVNFSRLQLARDIMVRNGDAAKPIWVSEYGWDSLPPGWQGRPSTWGPPVSEDTQARYMIEGLDRMRDEWPWVGAVFVWAFRFPDPPSAHPDDPAPYFAVVNHDFTPRPAYTALQNWAQAQAIATAGPIGLGDARLDYQGPWRDQEVGGKQYRLATGPGATLRVAFRGTDATLRARTGPSAGRVYVTIDGRPVPGLPADAKGTYVSLRNTEVVDDDLTLATGLKDGDHLLELRAPDDGSLALAGLTFGRRQPFAWVAPLLFGTGLAGLFAGLLLLFHTLALGFGWLPPAGPEPPRRRGLAWWDTRE
ncbi:MAG TPA: beta-galactosidase [Thermomicrobiales bacterium]|nr:beta-galactosidase [Thermomicrobiales bacterium]